MLAIPCVSVSFAWPLFVALQPVGCGKPTHRQYAACIYSCCGFLLLEDAACTYCLGSRFRLFLRISHRNELSARVKCPKSAETLASDSRKERSRPCRHFISPVHLEDCTSTLQLPSARFHQQCLDGPGELSRKFAEGPHKSATSSLACHVPLAQRRLQRCRINLQDPSLHLVLRENAEVEILTAQNTAHVPAPPTTLHDTPNAIT